MNLRFSVGEVAIYARAHKPSPRVLGRLGEEVVIASVGPFPPRHRFSDGSLNLSGEFRDYEIRFSDGHTALGRDWQLRKKRPPTSPEVLETFKAKSREVEA